VTQESKKKGGWEETKTDLKWAAALLFAFVLAAPVLAQYANYPLGIGYASWGSAPAGEENLDKITDAIFDPNGALVAPFEILSVLLLAALIAGVVMAYRDVEVG